MTITTAAQPLDLEALFGAAIESAYPIPDTPHTSVMQRANDSRAAFTKGWNAALIAQDRASQPARIGVAANGDRAITQDWMAYCTILRQAGKEPTDAQGDAFEFAWNAARAAQPESATGTTGASVDTLEFRVLLDEFAYRASERRAMGGDFGSADAEEEAEAALIAHIDATIGDLRAQLAATTENLQTAVREAWEANAELSKLRAQLAAKGQGDAVAKMSTFQVRVDAENLNSGARKFTVRMAPASAQPADPMDWPLPCDVTVGAGTIRKGCKLRTLVARMESLHRMAVKAFPEPTAEARTLVDSMMAGACNPDAGAQPDRGAAQPTAWLATDLDGRGDVGFTKEEAKRRAGEGCTRFYPLYEPSDIAPASQPVAPETAQGDALHWPHDPTETACSSCGLTMGESRLLHDLKRGEMVAVAPSDAKGKADAANAGRLLPTITAEELAAFDRFCECAEDFDSGGHDVPKDMMKRLAAIGLVRACGFGRHETTLFGDAIRNGDVDTSAADAKDAAQDFARGAIAALAVMTSHGHPHGSTYHDDIVRTVGEKVIYSVAEDDDYAWAGLNPRKKPKRAAMAAAPSSEKGGAK